MTSVSRRPDALSVRSLSPARVLGAVIAFTFVFGPAAAGVLGVREKPIENRPLSPAPRIDQGWAAFDAITPWAVDRLPGRARAVRIKANMDYYGYGELPGTQVAQPPGSTGLRSPGGTLSPTVLRGKDRYLFYGQDFTTACGTSTRFARALENVVELGRVIEESGRKVVITVAPNKSSVITSALPRAVPRGRCATDGIRTESRVLDTFADPLFVALRRPLVDLAASGKDAYWRTDTHWTSLGGSLWVTRLAEKLDPSLPSRLRITPITTTKVGDLTALIGMSFTESPDSVRISTGGTVTDTRPTGYDPKKGVRQTATWTTAPATGLVPGRTVLVGDSFTFAILPNLQPLFADGTFDWLASTPNADIVDHIVRSDTVVLEVAERYVVTSVLSNPAFRKKVAARLGVRS